MIATGLFAVCGLAFAVVFLLLGLLAAFMSLMAGLFPERSASDAPDAGPGDAAVTAAIVTVAASVHPGGRVTRIEEER